MSLEEPDHVRCADCRPGAAPRPPSESVGRDRRDAFGDADGAVSPLRQGILWLRRPGRLGRRGPVLSLTRKQDGKTVTRLIPAEAGAEVQAQNAAYRRFRELSKALIEVSDALSEARLAAGRPRPAAAEKRGLRRSVRGRVQPQDCRRAHQARRTGGGRRAGLRGLRTTERGPHRLLRPDGGVRLRTDGALRRPPPEDVRYRTGAGDAGTRLLPLRCLPRGRVPAGPSVGPARRRAVSHRHADGGTGGGGGGWQLRRRERAV